MLIERRGGAGRGERRRRDAVRQRVAALALVAGCLGGLFPASVARADTWIERTTGPITLRFRPGDEAVADAAALRVADHWRDLVALFGPPTASAPIVRLHPTPDDLLAAQPLARQVGDDWLVPSRPRRELSVLVPRAPSGAVGSPFDAEALDTAIHAALARHLVAEAARGQLPEAFEEGIVRFLAPPSDASSAQTVAGVAALRAALADGTVLDWSVLASPGGLYERPELALAEARAVAQYLAERGGLTALVGLPAAAALASGWRAALEVGFDAAPERLEAGWLDWLPGYLDHGWRHHALYDDALDIAEARIAVGDYAGADVYLSASAGYATRAGGEVAVRHARLFEAAAAGRAALADVAAARDDLERGEYAEAAVAASRARDRLATLRLATPEAAAAALEARARRGAAAVARLAQAEAAPAWNALVARGDADAAADDLALLGGDLAARHALSVRSALDGVLRPVGALLAVVGLIVMADSARRRRQPGSALG